MEVFDSLQKYLRYLKIKHRNPSDKLNTILLTIVNLFSIFLLFSSSLWFILFEEKSFIDFVITFYMISTALLNFFTYSTFLWKRLEFLRLIDDVKLVIEKRMQNKESILMYQETIKTVEKYSNAFGVFMIGACTFIYSTSLLVSYWNFFTTENYKFRFNYPASLPYDSTWWGFFYGTVTQFVAIFNVVTLCTCILSLLFGMFMIVLVLANDIRVHLNDLNELILSVSNEELPRYMEINQKLCSIFELQGIIRENTDEFSSAYGTIALGYFMWGICCICTGLITVQNMAQHINEYSSSSEFLFPPSFIIGAFGQIYLLCHFGHGLSTGQEEIAAEFYQISWYQLPPRMQKLLILPIMAAQNPIQLQAFGSIECTRGMFTKLVNRAFSFFTVLRQFEF